MAAWKLRSWKNVFDNTDDFMADIATLQPMELLHSFDVYSLRIELRRLGISISDQEGMQLSEGKAKELTSYMTEFTRSLLGQIYGGGENNIEDMDQLLAMFKSPD